LGFARVCLTSSVPKLRISILIFFRSSDIISLNVLKTSSTIFSVFTIETPRLVAVLPKISATCIRVPVTNGHLASVNIEFKTKPKKEDLIDSIVNFENPIQNLNLPSSPKIFLQYFEEEDRPQTLLDRNLENGMGIGVGRIREDSILQWKFVALSHNTIRGAAGGAILMAEMLTKKGYIK